MKIIKYLLAIISLSSLSFSPVENALKVVTSNCHQTFHFFFISQGTPTFWIGEDVSGECEYSKLLRINIIDSTVSVSQTELKKYKNWGIIPELNSLLRIYEETPLELNDSEWKNEDFKIIAPDYDSSLSVEFNDHIRKGGSNAYSWIKVKGNDGIKLPEIEGIKTELLYSYKTGLYINYEITDVHYFPSLYVLIFTHQPRKAVGLDTMHGFLIFKVEKDS